MLGHTETPNRHASGLLTCAGPGCTETFYPKKPGQVYHHARCRQRGYVARFQTKLATTAQETAQQLVREKLRQHRAIVRRHAQRETAFTLEVLRRLKRRGLVAWTDPRGLVFAVVRGGRLVLIAPNLRATTFIADIRRARGRVIVAPTPAAAIDALERSTGARL